MCKNALVASNRWLIFAVFLCFQGESGQNNLASPSTADAAIKNFEKKFKDKTKNNWSDRENFVSHSGKYTLIEVDGDQDAEVKVFRLIVFEVLEVFKRITHLTISNMLCFIQVDTVDGGDVKVKTEQHVLPCTLDEATQRLIRFIFNNDMFKEAMTSMNLG